MKKWLKTALNLSLFFLLNIVSSAAFVVFVLSFLQKGNNLATILSLSVFMTINWILVIGLLMVVSRDFAERIIDTIAKCLLQAAMMMLTYKGGVEIGTDETKMVQ